MNRSYEKHKQMSSSVSRLIKSKLVNSELSIKDTVRHIPSFDSQVSKPYLSSYLYKKRDEDAFRPKNVIFCLSIRKLYLESSQRYKKFSFCLIRSLYKESKIKKSMSPKRNSSRNSFGSKKNLKPYKIYSKDRENLIINMLMKNKLKLIKTKSFHLWQKKYKEKTFFKTLARKKIINGVKRLLSRVFKEIIYNLKKIDKKKLLFSLIAKRITKTVKKKLLKIIFSNPRILRQIAMKSFCILTKPKHVFPVFFNAPKKKISETNLIHATSISNYKKNIYTNSSISKWKLEKYRIGFQKLIKFNDLNKIFKRSAFGYFEKHRKLEKNREQKNFASSKIFSILHHYTLHEKKGAFLILEQNSIKKARLSKCFLHFLSIFNE